MTKAAERIIQALLPRKPAPILERQTGLPYGWGLWLRTLRAERGAIPRDKSENIVRDLMQRPPPPRGAIAPALGFWGGLRSLFHQQWEPPLREERPLRWFASAVSLLMHALFVLLLVWVAVVRLPPPPEQAGEGSRVRVEYIGRGTPEEEGGGAPAQASPSTTDSASASASAPSATSHADTEVDTTPRRLPEFVPPSPAVSAQVPQVREREIAEPAPPAAQPVQVTETPVPQTEYVLPPPTVRNDALRAPAISAREIPVQEREVVVVPTPQVPRVARDIVIPAPQIQRPSPQVQEREVSAPLPQVRTVDVPSRIAPTRDVQAPSIAVREREIAAPRPAPASGEATQPATAAASGRAPTPTPATGTAPGSNPASNPAPGSRSSATASGPASADRSGGWTTPARGDDWGASQRNVAGDSGASAGRTPGLFNADGSVRLPGSSAGTESTADRGAPGGASDQWTSERIEQSGVWRARKGVDYEASSFDKYWVPNESLLAEWVRRNIRETVIPIPGTNKKIRCVISVLQLGGGCGVFDPNLNEQPATARPPPEIPVKRTPLPVDS